MAVIPYALLPVRITIALWYILRRPIMDRTAMSYYFTILGPRNIKILLAHQSERTRWSVWRNEFKEIEWQVFMDRTISDRKQLMENTICYSCLLASSCCCTVVFFMESAIATAMVFYCSIPTQSMNC